MAYSQSSAKGLQKSNNNHQCLAKTISTIENNFESSQPL